MKNYHPESFDLDIYVQDFRGLGRGRGFKSLGRRSILHNGAVLSPLTDRILDLVVLLRDEGHIDDSELSDRLGPFEAADEGDRDQSADDLGAMKAWQEDTIRDIEKIADEAYGAAEVEDREEEEDPVEDLRTGVGLLIDENQALKARVEELESG